MSEWVPKDLDNGGPRYLEIVAALERDIAGGVLVPNTRLLPHRNMAERLGISVGTVSKAYSEAEKRGLISGEVGRGTFVLGRGASPKAIEAVDGRRRLNLAINAPPSTGEDVVIARTLADIAGSAEFATLLGYRPHQGSASHRRAFAEWLTNQGMPASVDSIFVTHGAQHGISTAIGLLARPGDVILTENLTYSGILALADRSGYQLRGVMMDDHGLIPAELDRSLRETRASVLYCMPTLHTPTGVVMPEQRRVEIVEIIRQHDVFVVEDDAYGFLCNPAVLPLSARLPERSFYIQSFAKSLAPGLRVGAMLVPTMFRDRCVRAIRSTSWMATPIMAEVVSRLIDDGQLETQSRKKRETAARRYALAQSILGGSISPATTPGFHVWLHLPIGRSAAALVAQAAMAGITIAAPEGVQSYDPPSNGIRLCLGAPQSNSDVEFALRTIRQILDAVEPMSLV